MNPSISDRVESIARARAAHPAVRSPTSELTYGQLVARAAAVANGLLEAGLRPGDRVALLLNDRPAECVALLGVVKAGGIAVPLVPAHPQARLRQFCDAAAPRFLVTDTSGLGLARTLVGSAVPVFEMEGLPPAPAREWPTVDDVSPAVILYTSGSSGTPKGVVQTHRSAIHRADTWLTTLSATESDNIAMFSTYAVGQGLACILTALLSGGTLCAFDVRREGYDRLANWLAEERITIYVSVATLFRSFVKSLQPGWQLPTIRLVYLGGERVTLDDVAAHGRLFPRADLIVRYASTEAGTISTHLVLPDETFSIGAVLVGRPCKGYSISIVDDEGRDVPAGCEGQILVRSAYLSPGYWNDDERTARSFSPAHDSPGERVFATGDVGRLRADGCLEHLGRSDARVKIRGFGIELTEVETALGGHPQVSRAVVTAQSLRDGDPQLIAYVEAVKGENLSIESLRTHLEARLPDYMVPSRFVVLDALPLTDSGKPDRRRLPDPPSDNPLRQPAPVGPTTSTEEIVAGVWREVLGLESVGVQDRFLLVGGDSLKAMRIASRLYSRFGEQLSLEGVLASTIAETAALLDERCAGDNAAPRRPIGAQQT